MDSLSHDVSHRLVQAFTIIVHTSILYPSKIYTVYIHLYFASFFIQLLTFRGVRAKKV